MSTTPAYPTGRGLAGQPRAAALGLVAALYVIVILAAWAVAAALPHRHPLTAVAAADIVATLIVFLASMAVANSSMYDPYWSVAPPVVAIYLLTQAPGSLPGGVVTRHVAVIVLILVWAVRLTGNWAWGWPGFRHEDWRYVDMRNDSGGRAPWAAVSFLGVHLFPTIIVFLAMLPLWPALAAGTHGLGPLDALAVVVTAGAIALELVADVQLHRFTGDAAHRGQIMNRGLWSISRHPNYLGELSFWWGLWLFGLAADPSWWWTVVGPVAMTLMFLLASVPMLDRRSLARRPGYDAHMQQVPALFPRLWPTRSH